MSQLLVAIVNYRTAPLVVDCLRSLEPQIAAITGAKVAIADNDSQDGSVEVIRKAIEENRWGAWASIVGLPDNGGFAAGNNALIGPALKQSDRPEFVLLLNPDTRVLPGALDALLGFMREHPKVGILGAHQESPDGVPLRSAFRFVNPLGEFDGTLRLGVVSKLLRPWQHAPEIPKEPTRTDWVSGGCMLIRSAVFDSIGLMDDGYFLYFEEMDYCLQALRGGWETWFLPGARIVHHGGQSTGVTGIYRIPSRRPKYWFDSRRRYYQKNFPRSLTMAADAFHLVGTGLWKARRTLQGKPELDPPHFLEDFWEHSVFVRGFDG